MGRDSSTTPPPSRPVRLAALHSCNSSTSSISFTSIFLRTLLHNGRPSTPLQSIRYALFLSRRGVYPPAGSPLATAIPTQYPLPTSSSFFSRSCALFCTFLHFFCTHQKR